ncbi:MAG: tRNA pseudouridine(13) synthase TruD, partial [Candidatus Thorarchaeota archaeon]
MKRSHPLEVSMGIEFYSTDILGTGGRTKKHYESFIVEEITPTGEALSIRQWTEDADYTIDGDRRKHIHFSVQKMGLTTMDVASILAAELKIPRHLVNYAGLKDKRAVTIQRMSVPSGAQRYFGDMRLSRIMISGLQYARKALQIGDLWGNRFTIRLEDMDVACEEALESARTLGEHQLLNYFGVQRFGITRPSTFLVGKSLVMRDYEEAVRVMLTPTNEYESDELTEARLKLRDELHPTEKIL